MNVENRKLFRNKDARSRLASMGGIMGSSPELLGTVQKFQEGGEVKPTPVSIGNALFYIDMQTGTVFDDQGAVISDPSVINVVSIKATQMAQAPSTEGVQQIKTLDTSGSSALDELRATQANIATTEGIGSLPVSPGEQPFMFSDTTGVSRDGRTNEEILAQARSLMPQPNRDSSGSLLPVAEPVAAPSFQSLPMNVAADSGPESGMFSDDVKGGFNIMPPAPYLSEAEQLLQQEPRVSGPFANVPRNYGTGIEAAQLNAMETGDVSLPVTSSEQLLTDNSDQGGLLSSIKSFAGDVIGDLKEGGTKYFDKRIAQQDASDVEETADLSRLQANYQEILDKLAGGNLSDNERTVLNRRKLALEEQYDANILATAIDPKNISRRITGALAKTGGNILAATGGDDETAVNILDAADAMSASATTGKLDTLEAIRTAEAEAREQGEEIDPALLAAVTSKIETDTSADTSTSTKLPSKNLIDIKKVTEELTNGRNGSNALVGSFTGTEQKLNPKEAVLAQQAIFKEMLGIKDEDKAKEKWHNMAMIGFAIAAGQDPNALSNVASGLLEGTKMAREDRKANQKRDDEITMMSIQAVQDQKNRDDAYTQAMDVASVRSKGAPSTYTNERLRQSIIAKLPTTIDDYEDLGLVTNNKVDFKLVENYIQNQMKLGSGTTTTTPLTTDIPSGLPDPTTLSEGQTVTDRETGQVYTVVGGAWQ